MKKLLYRKRYTTLSLLGILLLVGFGVWYNASVDTPAKAFMKKEPTWQTTNPVVAQDFASIKLTGKVKSNGFAIVAPRRVGIIQDLLVDIGDSVRKGETLGYLFPDGVEGQSSSSIAQASTQLAKARAELVNAQGVALDAVNFAQQGLRETQTKLSNLKDTSDASRNQLQQKHQEARTVATQVFENLKRLLFGSTNLNNSNRSILGDFSNRIQETKVENSVTEIERMEAAGLNGQEDIYDHLSHVTELLKEAEILYKSAKESRGSSMELIEKNLKAIQSDQIRVLKAQESLDDVILQVRELASTLDKSQESLNLVKSQQNLSITNLENAVEVALANYNAALVKAGHQRIVAPFDGVISGRMVEVGQGVTPNTVLFHMEGVPTARADQSLFEVHFAIPESWVGKVSVGDTIKLKKPIIGETFEGTLLRLSDQINLQTGMTMATAIVILPPDKGDGERSEPGGLVHGQSLLVYLSDQTSPIFSVPTQALKKRGTDYFLWKTPPLSGKEASPVKIQVEVVAEDGEFSQIFTRELTPEDNIISNPSVSLFRTS